MGCHSLLLLFIPQGIKSPGNGMAEHQNTYFQAHPKVFRLETWDPSVRAAHLMDVLEKCVQVV